MRKDNMNNKPTYFISGGGTGGHIYPALAVINELKRNYDCNVFYLGNKNNPEYQLAQNDGIDFLHVNINAMPRKISLCSIFWAFKLLFSIIGCIFYLKKYKPKMILGTGGYVSAPILFAAKFLRYPYMLHDADAHPGIVTRCFSANAKLLTTPFEVVKKEFSYANVEVTGNPIREDFSSLSKEDAKNKMGISGLSLLVMGGSQGARSINTAIIPILKKLIEDTNICIVHQSGKKNFDDVKEMLNKYFPDYESNSNYRLLPYIDDMPTVLKSSDLAISRSGSLSLSEMKASAVASILIPYPFSAGDHQKINAMAMVEQGCSIMIEDGELSSQKLYDVIVDLVNTPEKLNQMKKSASDNAMLDATSKIVERLTSF